MKYKCKKKVVFSMKSNFTALENIIKSVSLNIAHEFGVDETANIGKINIFRFLNSDILPIFFKFPIHFKETQTNYKN